MRTYSIGNKPIDTSLEICNYTKLIIGQTISRKQHLQNSWTNIKKPVHVVRVQSCPDDISLMIHLQVVYFSQYQWRLCLINYTMLEKCKSKRQSEFLMIILHLLPLISYSL